MANRLYDTVFGLVRRGDKRPDGFRFVGFYNHGEEKWASPKAWATQIKTLRRNNQKRNEAIKHNPAERNRLTRKNQKFRRNHPALCLLYAARHRAKKHGLPCTLIVSDVLIPKVCPILGIPLKSRMGTGHKHGADSPSIDQIVPGQGYVPANVIVISRLANAIKTNATPDQILKVGYFYKKLQREKKHEN